MDKKLKKVCTKCDEEKILDDFDLSKNGKYGRSAKCKECRKKYYQQNKNKILKNQRETYLKNKDVINKRNKKYQEQNVDKIKEYQKKYRDENKGKAKIYNKEYRKNNKKELYEKKKIYNEKTKDRRKKYFRNYMKVNKKNNPEFKLKINLRNLFNETLKFQAIKKSDTFFSYTRIHIQKYIEHFKQSKYWGDYCNNKNIQIDHIIPCSAYDFNNHKEIKKCWQLENLRFIPALKNQSKGNKIDLDLIKLHEIEHLLPEKLQNKAS